MIEVEEERIKFNKHGRSSQSFHQTDKKTMKHSAVVYMLRVLTIKK